MAVCYNVALTSLYVKRRTIDGVKKIKKVSPSTVLVLEEAEKLGIEWEKISYTDLFKLTFQNEVKYFHGQIPSSTTEFAYYVCNNKRLSKNILIKAGISVSKGYQIEYDDKKTYRLSLFKDLQKPLVVKPVDDQQGNNVFLNLRSQADYISAMRKVYEYYGQKKVEILVEEMFVGDEYRILATQKKILSVIKRIPANVTGDGKSTILELIENKNQDPIRAKVATYKEIQVDENLNQYLQDQGHNLTSILEVGQRIFLRPHSPYDISFGGDTIDVTGEIHPSVIEVVQKIMDSIPGLALVGIDYMASDITSPQTAESYKIIEINSSPSLDWHEFPIVGPHRQIAHEFLKIMFPSLD